MTIRETIYKVKPDNKTKNFVSRAILVHGKRYDYSLTDYKYSREKVKIICNKHGVFEQTPQVHLGGSNCQRCARELTSLKNCLSTEVFIKKSKLIHEDNYDYSLCKYTRSKDKVDIVCSQHGVFKQKPNTHLRGHGCPKCGEESRSEIITLSQEDFIRKSSILHNKRYDYSLVKYKDRFTKVIITCPLHGNFLKVPANHLNGTGCVECSYEGRTAPGFSKTAYCERFPISKLYIIKCIGGEEDFFKIGITANKVKDRFTNSALPYEYSVVGIIEGASEVIWDLEKELHRQHKEFRYIPRKEFPGRTECFSYVDEKTLKIFKK